jgi:hypothetical protein
LNARTVLTLAVLAWRAHATQPPLHAATVLATIRVEGPARAIDRYFLTDATFGDAVLQGIASGDSSWLRVARELRSASDAGVSESLEIAVADALPHAPAAVLRMLGPDFAPERICGLPFIEQPDAEEAAYYRETLVALATVRSPELLARRDRCRAILQRVHAGPRTPAV